MTRSQLTTFALAMTAAAALPATLTWKALATMPKDPTHVAQSFPVAKTDEEWQASLTPRQYAVLRRHDTEYPGTSPLLEEHRDGTFACAGCGQVLFTSETKYESGSGWPSFYAAVEGAVGTNEDRSLGMRARRDLLQPVRRAPRPRVSRRPAADGPPLLHQRRGAEVRAGDERPIRRQGLGGRRACP